MIYYQNRSNSILKHPNCGIKKVASDQTASRTTLPILHIPRKRPKLNRSETTLSLNQPTRKLNASVPNVLFLQTQLKENWRLEICVMLQHALDALSSQSVNKLS